MARVLKEFLTWRARETREGGGFLRPEAWGTWLVRFRVPSLDRSCFDADPLPFLLATHLLGRFVLAQPDIDRLPQEIVGGPGEKGGLDDELRVDPMHVRQQERRAKPR